MCHIAEAKWHRREGALHRSLSYSTTCTSMGQSWHVSNITLFCSLCTHHTVGVQETIQATVYLCFTLHKIYTPYQQAPLFLPVPNVFDQVEQEKLDFARGFLCTPGRFINYIVGTLLHSDSYFPLGPCGIAGPSYINRTPHDAIKCVT